MLWAQGVTGARIKIAAPFSWIDELFTHGRECLLRVGIEFPFTDRSWSGGINMIAHLLHALAQQECRRLQPIVIAAPDTPRELLEELPPIEVLRTKLVDTKSRAYLLRRLAKKALGHDPTMEAWLRSNDISVLSHCSSLGRRSSVPTVGFMPDFNVFHFKHLYSDAAWRRTYAGTARVCDEWDTLLLHAHAVADDYRAFFPAPKQSPLCFTSFPPISVPFVMQSRFRPSLRDTRHPRNTSTRQTSFGFIRIIG